VIVLIGCTRDRSQVERHRLTTPNPTSFEFHVGLQRARELAIASLDASRQRQRPIFGNSLASPLISTAVFEVETRESAIVGRNLLAQPGNSEDLYLHTYAEPLWASPVYRKRGGSTGLPFLADFHVHFAGAEESKTIVSVTAHNAKVRNGESFVLGIAGLGWALIQDTVDATTIEEYMILRYIGEALGDTSMPPVQLPK
jgi:hypothetical protein